MAELIAAFLARDQPWHDWVLVMTGAVVAGITAYFSAYLGKSAEYRAINENFRIQLEQLKEQTVEVETIKEDFVTQAEALKSLLATQGALGKELRDAVRDLTMAMCRSLHAMSWLTWWTKTETEISQDRLVEYGKEQNTMLPIILGQRAVVSAIDKETYEELTALVNGIFELDARITKIFMDGLSNDIFEVSDIETLYREVNKWENELPRTISNIMGRIAMRPIRLA